MCDPRAERRLGGEMLREADGIAVASRLGEADHVGGGDRLRMPLDLADGEVLEIEHAQLEKHGAIAPRHRQCAATAGQGQRRVRHLLRKTPSSKFDSDLMTHTRSSPSAASGSARGTGGSTWTREIGVSVEF
jgi:hypothetical protein